MSPWALLAGVVAWCTSLYVAFGIGQDHEVAKHAREQAIGDRAAAIASDVAASAIAGIKVNHTTITNEVQREIRERTVYRDCLHSAEQLRRINDALTGRGAQPAGGSGVPGADAAAGR